MEAGKQGWAESVIRRCLPEATGRGGEKIVDKEERSGGSGSQKAHLVVSVGCVVLEERDALAIQAPIVPLPLLGEVLERLRLSAPQAARALTLIPANPRPAPDLDLVPPLP